MMMIKWLKWKGGCEEDDQREKRDEEERREERGGICKNNWRLDCLESELKVFFFIIIFFCILECMIMFECNLILQSSLGLERRRSRVQETSVRFFHEWESERGSLIVKHTQMMQIFVSSWWRVKDTWRRRVWDQNWGEIMRWRTLKSCGSEN